MKEYFLNSCSPNYIGGNNVKKNYWIGFALSVTFLMACGDKEVENHSNHEQSNEQKQAQEHSNMNHVGNSSVPVDLLEANNPTYAIGDKAILTTEHMGGMKGAEATIVGAYETTVYAVTYTPTTGEEQVTNHKWVIHEELGGIAGKPVAVGDQVILEADHMEGMNGAEATIESAEKTIVYMVDYTSTNGEEVKNHKWVTEDELTSVQ